MSSEIVSDSSTSYNLPAILPVILDGTFFTVTFINADSNKVSAKCELCHVEKIIKGALSSSGNFLLHLKRSHPESLNAYEQRKKDEGPSIKRRKLEEKTRTNSTTVTFNSPESLAITKMEPAKLRNATSIDQLIFNFIAKGMHPLSTVEQPEFISLVKGLNPQVSVPLRHQLQRQITEQHTKMINEIKKRVTGINSFCVTVDQWRSGDVKFLSVTIHWISECLKRDSVVLYCGRIPPGQINVASRVNSTIELYGIASEKVVKLLTKENSDLEVKTEVDTHAEQPRQFHVFPSAQEYPNIMLGQVWIDAVEDITIEVHKSAMSKCQLLRRNITDKTKTGNNNVERNYDTDGTVCATYDCAKRILSGAFDEQTLSEHEFKYLQEYVECVRPIAVALARLGAKENGFHGELLPTLLTVERRIEESIDSATFKLCMPLARALLAGLRSRFRKLLALDAERSDAIVASVSHPYFKLRWVPEHKIKEVWDSFLKEACLLQSRQAVGSVTTVSLDDALDLKLKQKCDDDFFAFTSSAGSETASSPLVDKVHIECLQYLESSDTGVQMLNHFPSVRTVFAKHNCAPLSSKLTELMLHLPQAIQIKPSQEDDFFENCVILNQYNSN